MNRESLALLLLGSKVRIANGDRRLAHQRDLIARLALDGHPTDEAERLLRLFEYAQQNYIESCHRLRLELERSDPWKRLNADRFQP